MNNKLMNAIEQRDELATNVAENVTLAHWFTEQRIRLNDALLRGEITPEQRIADGLALVETVANWSK